MKFDRTYFTNKARSIKSERRTAEQLGGTVQPASGALPYFSKKGDVKTNGFLVDVKLFGGNEIRLHAKVFKKLAAEAWQNGRRPMINLKSPELDLVVVDMETWLEITKRIAQ